jgi:uncharacterized membrane protein YecN with MAPEG domain
MALFEGKGGSMPITALYASLLVPLYILLAARTILMRFSARISVGDGGDKELLRRMRVHANFAEYVPFALLLMGLAESLALDPRLLHGVGIVLALGRSAHAYGMSRRKDILPLRSGGVIATLSVLIVLAASCFFLSMRRGFGF